MKEPKKDPPLIISLLAFIVTDLVGMLCVDDHWFLSLPLPVLSRPPGVQLWTVGGEKTWESQSVWAHRDSTWGPCGQDSAWPGVAWRGMVGPQ